MTAMALLTYALCSAMVTASALRNARWTARSPRLALIAWHLLTSNVVLSATLAGVALAAGLPQLEWDPSGWVEVCLDSIRQAYRSPLGSVGSLIGLAWTGTILGRLAVVTVRTTTTGWRSRARITGLTQLIGRQGEVPGVTVIEHQASSVFCVPGRRGRIVLTTAALDVLAPDELAAVLAHERAHLRGRHHALVTWSRVLAAAFPWLRIFRDARTETAHLVELLADDRARRSVPASHLADALGSLTQAPAPTGVLAANALGVAARVSRLAQPAPRLAPGATVAVVTGIAVSSTLPLAVALGPAIAALMRGICSLS